MKRGYSLNMSKKDIIRELAIKYKISEEEVERAADHQFKFVKQQMESDKLPAIRLPFFGVFKPNKRKLKHIQKHNERKRKDN